MTWEYLHLIAHSFPIVLSVTGVLVGVMGWIRDKPELERWALVALLVGGAFVIPAYVTGLVAADVVGNRIFVEPSIIQTHRFAATWAAIPIVTAGVLAGFALYESEDRRLRRFVILVGVVAAGAIGYAAYLGSQIVHPNEPVDPAETALELSRRDACTSIYAAAASPPGSVFFSPSRAS
jgi:phage shock protein PspC (stress-responsive transcriptional regulator)